MSILVSFILCWVCVILGWAGCGVWFPPLNLSPPAWRLTPWSSFSQWSLSQALWHHNVGEDWWISRTLTTWAINLWHYPFALVAAMNNYGMFMEAMSKNMSYFTPSTIITSHHSMIGLLILKKKSALHPTESAFLLHLPIRATAPKCLQLPRHLLTPLCNENITGY